MKQVALALLFVTMLFAVALLASATMLAGGYVLQRVAPIGLFHASLLFLSTVFTAVVAMGLGGIRQAIRSQGPSWVEWEEENVEADNEKAQPVDRPAGLPRQATAPRAPVGRNHPCPCGSGKKYKLCCLSHSTSQAEDAS